MHKEKEKEWLEENASKNPFFLLPHIEKAVITLISYLKL